MFLKVRKISAAFMLITAMTIVSAHADDNTFDRAPDEKQIKRPVLADDIKKVVKAIVKRKPFKDSSVDFRMRSIGDYRVYEIEVYLTPIGASSKPNPDPLYSEGDTIITDKPIDETRLYFFPITITERFNPNGENKFKVSRLATSLMTATMIDKAAGLEYAELDVFGFSYNVQDLGLGSNLAIKIAGIRIKKLWDVTRDGSVRLVLGGSIEGGLNSYGLKGNYSDTYSAKYFEGGTATGQVSGEIGLVFNKELSITAVQETNYNKSAALPATLEGKTLNHFSSKRYGGALSWRPKKHIDLNLQLTKDRYDITTYTPGDLPLDTKSEKSGLGMNAGVKFTW